MILLGMIRSGQHARPAAVPPPRAAPTAATSLDATLPRPDQVSPPASRPEPLPSPGVAPTQDAATAAHAAVEPVFGTVTEALQEGIEQTEAVNELIAFVSEILVPTFRSARNAVDAIAAAEVAATAVAAVRQARAALSRARSRAADYDPARRVSSDLDSLLSLPLPAESDFALHSDLTVEVDLRAEDLDALERGLSVELGPQEFRGETVAGAYRMPGAGDDVLNAVIREASMTVDLLATAAVMADRAWGGELASMREAVGYAEQWESRPLNFYFLYRVAQHAVGDHWAALAAVPGPSGRRLPQVLGDVQDIGREFGIMTDVGAFRPAEADDLLSYTAGDWRISDEEAMQVFEMIASASPAARLPILESLDRHGRLDRLCANLPGAAVRALLEAIGGAGGADAPEVAFRLQAHAASHAGGQTATEVYEAMIMENIAEENYVRAYLWTFLDVSHSALTLGFKDIHDGTYVARREGLISSDTYWSTTAKAAGRTAVLLAATAVTGGAAGGFAEGMALGRGLGATTSQLIGGGFGGAASGLSGQFTADVYDQALLGREGFSSAGDYAAATGLGAASGTLLAGIGSAGARCLPRSAERMMAYHTGSPAGQYRFAQGPRQWLHRSLHDLYRSSHIAGRNLSRRMSLPSGEYEIYFEFASGATREHIFCHNASGGGHLYPPFPEGGPPTAPGGPQGPESSFPRTYNQERIMEIVTETLSSPTQPWLQQSGPGQGTTVIGLPSNPPTTKAGNPVRYVAEIPVDGITVRVVVEPGADIHGQAPRGVITAFPAGSADPASRISTVPPYASSVHRLRRRP
jgi:hypothetical protein